MKDDYIVIILITKPFTARFITAFPVDVEDNLRKILEGPGWKI